MSILLGDNKQQMKNLVAVFQLNPPYLVKDILPMGDLVQYEP
jgi:hypothetical protein